MAIRLSGEEFSVVQGLDGQGALRRVEARDASPALEVVQLGSGDAFAVQDTSGDRLRLPSGGGLQVPDFVALGTSPAQSYGLIRLPPSNFALFFRNYADTQDLHALGLDTGDKLNVGNSTALGAIVIGAWGGSYDVRVVRPLDAQFPIKNTGANNAGAVAVEDDLRVAGNIIVFSGGLSGTSTVYLLASLNSVALRFRTTHPADSQLADDYGYLYFYDDGATRQAVFKLKRGGVVYTGTVNLT